MFQNLPRGRKNYTEGRLWYMRQNFSLEMKKYIFFFGLFEQNFVRASSNLLDMTNQQEWFNIQKV